MGILRERTVWKRTPTTTPRHHHGLTNEQRQHLAKALRALRRRLGSWQALATATGYAKPTLQLGATRPRRLGLGIAVRAAQVAGVSVEEIITGYWPKPGACVLCGRSG